MSNPQQAPNLLPFWQPAPLDLFVPWPEQAEHMVPEAQNLPQLPLGYIDDHPNYLPVLNFILKHTWGFEEIFLPGAKRDQIDVVRVPRLKENKQAREKHVLGLLTSLRAVFPGNVTEIIARQILPHAKYDPVPDHLQLKLPIKAKRQVQHDRKQVQHDKKVNPSRKHQAPFQRR
ncbi:hypothetical protein ABBQ38_009232 [Trebouxia sp. C0009 RCD-2024]